jgi:hypothetical protein
MPTCQGNTKSGNRCKRSVGEDVSYCSAHADQAAEPAGGDSSAEDCCESLFDGDPIDALLAIAVGGVLIGAALVFRRVFRVI